MALGLTFVMALSLFGCGGGDKDAAAPADDAAVADDAAAEETTEAPKDDAAKEDASGTETAADTSRPEGLGKKNMQRRMTSAAMKNMYGVM